MSIRRHMSKAVAALLVASVLTLLGALAVGAHTGDQSYLYIDVTPSALGGRVELPISDLRIATGLELDGNDDAIAAELLENESIVSAYLADKIRIGADGNEWPLTFQPADLFYSDLPERDDNYVVVFFDADVAGEAVPRELDVTFDPFFDEIEGRDSLLLIGNDWAGGVIDNGHDVQAAFTNANRSQVIDLGDTGWFKTVRASVKLGVNHIRTGPDHILFVLVLLLPSVLLMSAVGWAPTPSFTSALWRVMKVVTMFTVAHTITFTLAGLDLLPLPPSKWVEVIIAASIAAAALHNIWPITQGREWLMSFLFGLFHGMGFASLVGTLDTGRSTQLLSLLGRNIGIEIGQSLVVLLCFPLLFLMRRTRFYRPFFVGFSVILAVVSVGWMIERIAEVDLGMSSLIDPFVKFPNVVVYLGVLTLIAAIVHRMEDRAGRLISINDDVEMAEPVLVG